MISGNHFPPNPHVWLQRKIKFSGNHLPVDQNLRLWPRNEFTLSFSLQFISRSCNTLREWEKERRESPKQRATQREREEERREIKWEKEPNHFPATESSDLAIESSIQQTSERKNPLLRSSHRHRSTSRRWRRVQPDDHRPDQRPIQTNARTSSLQSRPTPDPAQPVDHRSSHSDHRAKHRLTVSFPEPVHRSHTHLTSDPHTSDPHTHLTSPTHLPDPIFALYIYIYLYIYLLFFIY